MTELLAYSPLQYLYDYTRCAICEHEPNVITFVFKVYFKNMDSHVSCTGHLLYIFIHQNHLIGFVPG